MDGFNLSNIKSLKELSWYLTIPLFTCAAVLQNIKVAPTANSEIYIYMFDWFTFVGEEFVKVLIFCVILFGFCSFVSAWIRVKLDISYFLLVIATMILSFSLVGVMLCVYKPNNIDLPINIVWFLGSTALSFNLFQMDSRVNS